jgi:polygalacturonase
VGEGSVREGTIVGNTIQARISPGGANVRFAGGADINRISMWTISGNHISNQAVNVHLKNCRGMTLTGNSLALSGERNVRVEGSRHIVLGAHSLDHNPDYKLPVVDGVTLRDCDGCIVSGLLIEDARGGSEAEGGAVELYNCREVTVTGCQVFEPRWRGIYVANGRNVRVADCTVLERTGTPAMLAGVQLVGACPGTFVQGNVVGRGRRGDIVNEASGATVEGNRTAAGGRE